MSIGILQQEHFPPLGFLEVFTMQVVYWLSATKGKEHDNAEKKTH